MRVTAVLKWAGVLVAALIVAAVAILYSIDANSYRGEIAAEFRKATGRDLVIDGGIDLSISLSPAIMVEKIAVANAPWGSRPLMATLARAEVKVELIPLIAGDIRVVKLVLIEPDILLETNAAGVANWRFGPPSEGRPKAGGSDSGAARGAESGGESRIPVFHRVEITRGRLAYKNGKTGEELRLDLGEAALGARTADGLLTIDAKGAWNRSPFSLSGTVEPFSNLASGGPVRLDVEARAFGLDAKLAGSVAQPGKAAGLDLRVAVRGADLSTLAPVAGAGLPKIGPIDLAADVKGGPGGLEIDRLKLVLASSDLSGKIVLARRGPRPRVTGRLESTRLVLAELLPPPRAAGGPGAAGGKKPKAAKTDPGRVFPDDPLPLAGLKAADLDLTLSVARLTTRSLRIDAVEGRVVLDGGVLTVEPFSATVAASRVDGTLRLDTRRAAPRLAVKLGAPNLDLGRLLNETGATDLVQGKAKLRADLRGSGRSVAALMAGLDGEVLLLAGDGRLKTQAFDTVVGGASAVLGTLFSGKKRWTVVNCAASSFAIAKGRATSRVTLIDTEYSTVAARGSLDLARETLRLTIEPRAKSATLNVAVPVHVRGTLADPVFRPDTGAALKKLGGLVGIALFPPAAVVGLGELGGGGNACVKLAAATRKGSAKTRPQAAPAQSASPEKAIRELKENAEGVVKGLTRGLRGIFGGGKN